MTTTTATTFEPTIDHETLATNLGVDLDKELASFRRFNRDRILVDADHAFSGWLRKAQRRAAPAGSPATAVKVAPVDPIAEFEWQHPQQHARLLAYLEGHRWWAGMTEGGRREEIRQAIASRHAIFEFLDEAGRSA